MSNDSGNLLDEKDKQALQYFEDITSNADEIQRQTLVEILSRNGHVEYLQQHGLDGSTDPSTFKSLIPVVSYEQLKPYIDRIANGDDSPILCAEPITEFYLSSGTSGGEQKLIPIFKQELERRLSSISFVTPKRKQMFPNWLQGKEMFFLFNKVGSTTKAGIIAHSVSSSICKSLHLSKNTQSGGNTSPSDVVLCTDTYQSIYSQLLCGLYQNHTVLTVGSMFGSTLAYVLKFLENHWILLANDIRTGTINSKVTDSSARESIMDILKPNPQLADFIEMECTKRTWEGIITRLWPNAKYITTIVSGSMSQYIPLLNYYSNNLPLISSHYASSECYLGVNMDPLCKPEEISYTLLPTMAYFEFLPIESEKTNGETSQELVDLVDVKLGQEYELIITTYAGLYRYCMGDILRVTGFKNKAPKFSFVCRKNIILSLDLEKTGEGELHNAVQEATLLLSPFGAVVVDYTSYGDNTTIPGHYVLYWEIRIKEESSIIPSSIYEDCCLAIEELLNVRYRQGRCQEKTLNPLEIKIVESGTFEKLMEQAVNQGVSISQYKTPRSVRSTPIIELLDSRVLSNHFSQKCPKWDPNNRHHLFSS